MNRKNLLITSIYIIVFLSISACGGDGGSKANPLSGGVLVAPPTTTLPSSTTPFVPEIPAPQAEVPYSLYTIFGQFRFDAFGPELNSLDFNNGIYPKPTNKQTETGFLTLEQDRNERFVISFRNLSPHESETLKLDVDIRLVQVPNKNERFPILSWSGSNESRWDWGIIRTGKVVKQYFRRRYSEGETTEVRSAPIEIIQQTPSSVIAFHASTIWADGKASFFDNKQNLENSSQDNEFDYNEAHFNAERFLISYDQLNIGWNAENDYFVGEMDNIQISR